MRRPQDTERPFFHLNLYATHKSLHRRRTLTPPSAPLSLLQSQKGEGAGCDDGMNNKEEKRCQKEEKRCQEPKKRKGVRNRLLTKKGYFVSYWKWEDQSGLQLVG